MVLPERETEKKRGFGRQEKILSVYLYIIVLREFDDGGADPPNYLVVLGRWCACQCVGVSVCVGYGGCGKGK